MNKDIKISKKKLIMIITVIIVLFTTTIITTTLLFSKDDTNEIGKQEKINNSNLTDEEVIEYLEGKGYNFQKLLYLDSGVFYTIIENNDNVYIQKILSPHMTLYTFKNNDYNDEHANIVNLSDNDNDEDIQYSAYQKWLQEINLNDNQIISVLDYYDENNVAEYIDMDKILNSDTKTIN